MCCFVDLIKRLCAHLAHTCLVQSGAVMHDEHALSHFCSVISFCRATYCQHCSRAAQPTNPPKGTNSVNFNYEVLIMLIYSEHKVSARLMSDPWDPGNTFGAHINIITVRRSSARGKVQFFRVTPHLHAVRKFPRE